jgi:hypothetical protein
VNTVFLGAIAVATVVMAVVQLGIIFFAARLARRVAQLSDQIQTEIVPVMASLKAAGENLERISGLAQVQVERFDRMLADISRRTGETVSLVQGAVLAPLREGMAVVAAIRGIISGLRAFRQRGSQAEGRFDDEDPLFIG